ANWKAYFAQTLNATAATPTIFQSVASDHVIHGSNISLAGFTTGTSPNRKLADFFQVAIDPQGMAFVSWADDSADFSGHAYVAHQIGGEVRRVVGPRDRKSTRLNSSHLGISYAVFCLKKKKKKNKKKIYI